MGEVRATIWYRRMSIVYLVGAWTAMGSVFLASWKGKKESDKEEVLKNEIPIENPEPRRGFYVETIVTYKENFVPYSTRLYNYWKSWSGGSGPSE